MGKKAAKKINRRIKRSARKTIGVLTLIMAIIVAAIPVPSASAVGGKESDTAAPAPVYPSSPANDAEITTPSKGSHTTNMAQMIYKAGSYYYLYDVFEYFMYEGSGGTTNSYGCISKYDNSYMPKDGKLVIPNQVYHDYPRYTEQQVIAWFTGKTTVLKDKEQETYYPDDWKAYTDYLARKEVWDSMTPAQQLQDPSKNPGPVVDKPSYKIEDFLEGAWVSEAGLRYFCYNHADLASGLQNKPGYMLIQVIDGTSSPSSASPIVYMPCQVGEKEDESEDYSDRFYAPAKNSCLIRYIGDGAFQNATSIKELEIPGYILTIGNDAFNGCSSITKVSAWSGTLGNRAFKNCAALNDVTLGDGIERIGTECFYGCNTLTEITFPTSVNKIGTGAFASCSDLNTIKMDGMDQRVELADYCFFNCPSIGSVTFGRNTRKIGEAAFALDADTSLRNTAWKQITFPDSVATLGDNVLYGRGCLESVVMPASYGSDYKEVKLGSGFFGGCYALKWVEFPDNGGNSCRYVTFGTNAFLDVVSEDFYIRGPELNNIGNPASPRTSSWAAGITYVFKDSDGVDQYEVSTGTYRFAVDTDGVLTDCTLLNKTEWQDKGSVIEVPATVGNKTVTGIGPACFSSKDIRENLKVLKIADGGRIESIADHAFEGYPKLEAVYIGNSVNAIGTSAFEDCEKLQTVVFSTPSGGYQNFKIGPNAFSTKSTQLTFYGDIVQGYAPFDWAMSKEVDADGYVGNWVDKDNLLRVCYSSGTPEHPNLKVLLDNDTNLVTLVGYPHYDQLDEITKHLYEAYINGTEVDTDLTGGQTSLNAEQSRWIDNVFDIVIPAGVESIDVKGFYESRNNRHDAEVYMPGDAYYAAYREHGLFNGYYGDIGSGTDLREYPEGSKYEQEPKGNDCIHSVTMSTVTYLPDRAFESCENLQTVVLGSAMEDIGTAPFTGCTRLTTVGGKGKDDKYIGENGIIYEANDTGLTIVECLPARGTLVGQPTISTANDPKILQVTQINEGAFENCTSVSNVDFVEATGLTRIPRNCFKGAETLHEVLLPETVNDIREEAFSTGSAVLSVRIPAVEVDIADDAFESVSKTVTLHSYTHSAVENYVDRQKARGKNIIFNSIDEEKKYRVQFWDSDGTVIPFVDEDGTETFVQYVKYNEAAYEPEHPTGRDGYVFDKWDKSFTRVTSDLIIIALYKWGYPDTSPGVLPNTSPGAGAPGAGTPGAGTPGAGTPGAGTPGAGTPGAGTPGAGTPGASNNQNSNQRYRLTVENGSGDGTYAAGTSIVITADTPPSGQRFERWTSIANDFNITSATSSITTITMPSHDLTIVANYTSGSSSAGNGNSSNISTNTNGNGNSGGTTVDITKPGISDTGVASATVEGSTDSYVVKITDTAEARAAVEAALINEYGTLDNLRYFAMDISLYDATGTVKITDTSNLAVNITMPIPDELRVYAGNNQVAGVVNGNVLDKLSPRFTTINGVPCISFTATHFSPYTVYVDTSNLSAGVSDSTPKTGDMIHPKWFLSIALACVSLILLLKKDKKPANVKTA